MTTSESSAQEKRIITLSAAALAGIYVSLAAGIILLVSPKNAFLPCLFGLIYLTAVSIACGITAAGLIRTDLYSRNTVFLAGFFLFTIPIVLSHLLVLIELMRSFGSAAADHLIYLNLSASRIALILAVPFLLVNIGLLAVSNAVLIQQGGFREVLIPGIAAALILLAAEVFLYFSGSSSTSISTAAVSEFFTHYLSTVFLYLLAMFSGVCVCGRIAGKEKKDMRIDYLILPGCGLNPDGSPSPLLRQRLDAAVSFWWKQKRKYNQEAEVFCAGGRSGDKNPPESAVMKAYLREYGIPKERIHEESQSSVAEEHMAKARIWLDTMPAGRCGFCTVDYSAFRLGRLARDAMIRADCIPVRSEWYYWPDAMVREFLAFLSEDRKREIAVLISLALYYLILTIMRYQ